MHPDSASCPTVSEPADHHPAEPDPETFEPIQAMKKPGPHLLRLPLLIVVCIGSWTLAAAAPKPARPNILFVFGDQWRAQAFGYAGDPNVRTPEFDRFHREAISFTNAVSGVPVCSPYRASLLTGKRVLTHGVFINDVPLAQDPDSIARVLTRAGYDTGYIGKWHVGGRGRGSFIPRQLRQGFDYWKALECTHNYNHSAYYEGDDPEVRWWDGYDAIAQTRDAQQYLRSRGAGAKPFVLFLSWGGPHDPYPQAPAELQALYPAEKLQLRPNVPPELEARARADSVGYYAHCTALDTCFGELRRTLRETGLEANTILVFTADHGDLLGSQGQRFKQQPYDESIRVPFMVQWPAGLGTQARQLDAPLSSPDIMPTLLGLAGVPIPAGVEGHDFSGYIRGGADPSGGEALLACPSPFGPQWGRAKGGREYRGLRTVRHTYVRDRNGPWLLFDNERDPYQLDNLVGRPEAAALQAALDARLQRRLQREGDEFLPGEAYIARWGYKTDASGAMPIIQ